MVSAPRFEELHATLTVEDDMTPRRPATINALDARLSVWGQAARDATKRRADALVEGVVLYVERVGRGAEVLRPRSFERGKPLLDTRTDTLVTLAANLAPQVVARSCRLLWVDPDRVRENMNEIIQPELEVARSEVRRLQALYRRRARLWESDQERLDRLRGDIEELKVPRSRDGTAEHVAKGLLLRHREEAGFEMVAPTLAQASRLRVGAGDISRWIKEIDERMPATSRHLRLAS